MYLGLCAVLTEATGHTVAPGFVVEELMGTGIIADTGVVGSAC